MGECVFYITLSALGELEGLRMCVASIYWRIVAEDFSLVVVVDGDDGIGMRGEGLASVGL